MLLDVGSGLTPSMEDRCLLGPQIEKQDVVGTLGTKKAPPIDRRDVRPLMVELPHEEARPEGLTDNGFDDSGSHPITTAVVG